MIRLQVDIQPGDIQPNVFVDNNLSLSARAQGC